MHVNIARGCCAITSLSLAHKIYKGCNVYKRNIFRNKVYDLIYFNYVQKAPSVVKYLSQYKLPIMFCC